MASRKKAPASGWELVPCDRASLEWSNSIGFMTPLEGGLFAANLDFVRVGIVDGSAPGAPKLLSEFKPQSTFTGVHYLPEWPALALISDGFIQFLDVTNPRKPTSRACFTYEVGHARALTFMGGDLYVTHENGIALLDQRAGKPKHLFDVPNDEFFGSYPTGLASHGEFLFVTGRHCGLHVYRRTSAEVFEAVRSVKKGYTPTDLQWWDPGRVLLMVGNEDIIAVDTGKPDDAKWAKSCKVKGAEFRSALARVDAKTGFVAGRAKSRDTLVFATIDLNKPLAAVVTETFTHKDKQLDFDSSSFVRVGDQVFVGGVYLESLLVFRRAH